jgi:hypothetical protein
MSDDETGPWHTGRKLGRTLYRGDVLVGMMDTPELAAAVVRAMNGAQAERKRCNYWALCAVSARDAIETAQCLDALRLGEPAPRCGHEMCRMDGGPVCLWAKPVDSGSADG